MTNAEYILKFLESHGIAYFFMIPGGYINPFLDCYKKELPNRLKIQPVLAAHEAGAAAMAEGYARATNKFGVCLAIDAPGALNALPMIANAQAELIPVILIVGRLNSDLECCGAFQDSSQSGINTVNIFKSFCNQSYSIDNSQTLTKYVYNTLKSMLGIKKGCGFLSIPKDILSQETEIKPIPVAQPCHYLDSLSLKKILTNQSKIVILIGSRNSSLDRYQQLINFCEQYYIPVVTTITSKGLFPQNHPLFLGQYGFCGHKRVHDLILNEKDLTILALDFDVSQWTTLAWNENFLKQHIIQVDLDPSYIGCFFSVNQEIVGDSGMFLKELAINGKEQLNRHLEHRKKWLNNFLQQPLTDKPKKSEYPSDSIHPAEVVIQASTILADNVIAVVDAGQHRTFVSHYWRNRFFNGFFSATKLAPMGWALPASIGIALAAPEQKVVVFVGDGCMLMSSNEIQSAVKLNLDLTIIVFNNGYYGATYSKNKDNLESITHIGTYDWANIAESFGAKGFKVNKLGQLKKILKLCSKREGVILIDVRTSHHVTPPNDLYVQTMKQRDKK